VARTLRLAVAQTTVPEDPADPGALRESGADLDLGSGDPDIDVAVRLARPWRRLARAGLYDKHLAREDPRSAARTSF
jgi:hypothetical protein